MTKKTKVKKTKKGECKMNNISEKFIMGLHDESVKHINPDWVEAKKAFYKNAMLLKKKFLSFALSFDLYENFNERLRALFNLRIESDYEDEAILLVHAKLEKEYILSQCACSCIVE
jgi:hypothetical protein